MNVVGEGNVRWARRLGGLAIATVLASLGCSTDSESEGGGPSGGGACEVAGGIIIATCYEGWNDCGTSTAHTLHKAKSCDDVGYTRACCSNYGDDLSKAKYWRPGQGSCDANDVVCGSTAPTQDKCQRCLNTCRGDSLCCTGRGCYCESECS